MNPECEWDPHGHVKKKDYFSFVSIRMNQIRVAG